MTKDFKGGRGIFDIDLSVHEGEIFGLVGINGSGKTTMIRHLMGFLRPQHGRCQIMRRDCWQQAARLKNAIGYIPGEISFPEVGSGIDFFKLQAAYREARNMKRAEKLCERFNLDASANLRRMSKGMKQKTAIVTAFMSDPKILLLDEGTTGLDPLMQKVFTELVKEERHRGKTVFMSSHMFDELENSCDRVAFLKNGHLIDIVELSQLRGNERVKEYKLGFANNQDFRSFLEHRFKVVARHDEHCQATIDIPDEDINELFRVLAVRNVSYITQKPQTLESYFKEKYNASEVAWS